MVPALFHNMKRALVPLLHDDTYKTMYAVTQAVEEAGRNPRSRPVTLSTRKNRLYQSGGAEISIPQRQLPTKGSRKRPATSSPGEPGNVDAGEEGGSAAVADSSELAGQVHSELTRDSTLSSCGNGVCIPCFEIA
jgi:hypothetical protein